jgi:quinol monooxygenase YgiN
MCSGNVQVTIIIMSIFVTAIIQCKKGHAADLKPFLLDLVYASRKQKACLRYDLHQSIDDENIFIINGEWAEKFWFALHNRQEHAEQFREASAAIIEQQAVYQTEKII